MADFESILSLDSMSGEQATRLAVYKTAEALVSRCAAPLDAGEVAEAMLGFIEGSNWRLEVVRMAVERTGRRTGSVERCLEIASGIADWVSPPRNIPVARAPVSVPVTTGVTRKKTATRK